MFRLRLNSILKNWEKKLVSLNEIGVSEKRILSNYNKYVRMNKGEVWPVLKGNAYGASIGVMCQILKQLNPRYIVVDSYMEALEVWLYLPHQSVLLIGSNRIENYRQIDFRKTTLMVQNIEEIEELGGIGKKVKVHLKLNSGMNRQGFDEEELEQLAKTTKIFPNIITEGVMSHLAKATDPKVVNIQQDCFIKMVEKLEKDGLKFEFLHLGATEGCKTVSNKRISVFRVGLGLYAGAVSWKSTIIKVRLVKKGEGVGYDLSQKMAQDGWVGLIAAGYYEGVDRRLSGEGWVKYNNNYYPIIGRISMNMMSVNFGKIKPRVYDRVEIIEMGAEGKCAVSQMAKDCQTIPYEILAKLNPKLKRVII
jgi:alanine racemase